MLVEIKKSSSTKRGQEDATGTQPHETHLQTDKTRRTNWPKDTKSQLDKKKVKNQKLVCSFIIFLCESEPGVDPARVIVFMPTGTRQNMSDMCSCAQWCFTSESWSRSNSERCSRSDTEVRLVCKGLFPYLDSEPEIWWTVDGKTLDKLPDHERFSKTNRWFYLSLCFFHWH